MRDKMKTPRELLVVVVLAWAPCTLAQDYPHSPVIADIVIEDTRDISFGDGDNFPMTWADDGKLYTMYCDGVGFDDISLDRWNSNGFAELVGTPPNVQGRNIPSPDMEFGGGGRKGRKASGLVCIKGVLYALVRNLKTDGTGTSLFWSTDRGTSWTEAEWNWPEIGLADWLNMGRDYCETPEQLITERFLFLRLIQRSNRHDSYADNQPEDHCRRPILHCGDRPCWVCQG